MESGKKIILYFMSVPWEWIKQRPHFLAEGLSDYYRVDVYYKKPTAIKAHNLVNDKPEQTNDFRIRSFRILPFYAIPVLKRLKLGIINSIALRFQVPSIRKYDYIWIPSPKLYKIIAPFISPNQKVIYDCMDDCAEFGNYSDDSFEKQTILKNEKRLLQRADYLIFSASYLKEKVLGRAGIMKKACIVNNAIQMPELDESPFMPEEIKQKLGIVKNLTKPLVYIGTIAKWFDFDTVISALNQDKCLNLILIGPANVAIPDHPQIVYLGTVKRDYIFSFMQLAYALVMPFIVNELIRSVNPVKLYEYIYTGRPVIAPKYGESEVFSEFVFLYKDKEEFLEAIEQAKVTIRDDNYREKCIEFLKHNTWKCRCMSVFNYLHN